MADRHSTIPFTSSFSWMRWLILGLILALCLLQSGVHAFEQEDFELFDLNDQVTTIKGPGTSFYSLLNISETATDTEIARAYRKTSLALHPDKNPSPEAAQLYKLLTSVFFQLKERRALYDKYLRRGFPRWRGTGYYYAKYKPGWGMMVFLILFSISATQYGSAWIVYLQRLAFFRAEQKRLNTMSISQLRKVMSKQQQQGGAGETEQTVAGAGKLSRRAFKSSKPADLLGVTEASIQAEYRPRLSQVAILAWPLFVYEKCQSLLKSSGIGPAAACKEGKKEA